MRAKKRDFGGENRYDPDLRILFRVNRSAFQPFRGSSASPKNFNSVRFCLNRFGNALGLPQAVSGDFHQQFI
jgi:hypothetical protein